MIVDWYRQCKKIDRTKTLDREDKSDNKSYYKQEIVYIHYLRTVKGYTEYQCYAEWLKIKNGVASIFKDDQENLAVEFTRIYRKTNKGYYKVVNCVEPLQPVIVYEDEVKYLNDLDVPMWVKQYWMCLLFYYKFASQTSDRVEKSVTLNSWCIRHTDVKNKEYGMYQDSIAQYRLKTGKNIFQMHDKRKSEKYPTYVPAFIKFGGKVACTYKKITDVDKALDLLKPTVKICPSCGKEFQVTSRTKRTVCLDCYNYGRKLYLNKKKQEERAKK